MTVMDLQTQFEALFLAFDASTTFQFFKSFRRVRVNFTEALAAAEAREKLHKSVFNGKEMRLYFAQVRTGQTYENGTHTHTHTYFFC